MQPNRKLSQTYRSYLQTDHWMELRSEVVNRDGHKCVACSSDYRIQAHHLIYRKLYDCVPSDLVTLCQDCHDIFHEMKDWRRDCGDVKTLDFMALDAGVRGKAIGQKIRAYAAIHHAGGLQKHMPHIDLNRSVLHEKKKTKKFLDYSTYVRRMA